MQFIPEIPDRVTVIIIQLHNIFCAVIKRGSYKKYSLNFVRDFSYHARIASSGMLINTMWIGSCIKNFLNKYKLDSSAVIVIFDDAIIPQGYSSTLEASAYEYLSKHLTLPHHTLNTIYLCPYEERFLSWWSRMPYALLMQLQLIAYMHQLNIIGVNAKLPVLLEAYKLMYGSNFRPLQLAIDLQRAKYDMTEIISSSVLQRFFETSFSGITMPHAIQAIILGAAAFYEKELL